jgi:predicted GNAT family acetyltransferase
VSIEFRDNTDASRYKGVGSTLIRSALEDVRRRELRAVPLCPFVASFLKRHPEYEDVVDDAYRAGAQPS